ncbi:Uncharacterized protein APZ42_001501, partial [Daphnia magna]
GRPPRGSSNIAEAEAEKLEDCFYYDDDVVYIDIGEILDRHSNEACPSLEFAEKEEDSELDSDTEICDPASCIHLPPSFSMHFS